MHWVEGRPVHSMVHHLGGTSAPTHSTRPTALHTPTPPPQPATRLQDIKAHPFFAGVRWSSLYEQTPPYRPALTHELDTQNFEQYEDEGDQACSLSPGASRPRSGPIADPNFIGYTYKNWDVVHAAQGGWGWGLLGRGGAAGSGARTGRGEGGREAWRYVWVVGCLGAGRLGLAG